MVEENKKGIKVNDKRHHSSGGESPDSHQAQGEGFTMKECNDPTHDHSHDHAHAIDFSTLVFSLAQMAFMGLGLTPDPRTHKIEKDLGVAKQHIDILGVLEEKTKGNLTEEEKILLEGLLVDLRLKFVEASKH